MAIRKAKRLKAKKRRRVMLVQETGYKRKFVSIKKLNQKLIKIESEMIILDNTRSKLLKNIKKIQSKMMLLDNTRSKLLKNIQKLV